MTDSPIELRELMKLAGLTFRALGERIGLNQAQIFKALSGEIRLRPELMRTMETAIVDAARDRAARLAAVLGVITPTAQLSEEISQGTSGAEVTSDFASTLKTSVTAQFQPCRKQAERLGL